MQFILFLTSLSTSNLVTKFRNSLLQSGYVTKEKYTVVIDAGSTGTRMHIYGFLTPGNIISYHASIKANPGLHSLSKKEIKKYLEKLLEDGRMKMSEKGVDIREVPVVLLGTAGLRSLSGYEKRRLLKQTNHIFKKFRLKNYKIDIISGFEEGILALKSLKSLVKYNNDIVYKYGCADIQLNKYLQKISKGFCKVRVQEKHYHGIIDMGGGSVQIAYEFPVDDSYNDPIHVIHSLDKNIYINFFAGWGLNEGIKVLRQNKKYILVDKEGNKTTLFDKLLDDFRMNHKPDINRVDDLYLLSYFYEKFRSLGCKTKTNLKEIKTKIDRKCSNKSISFKTVMVDAIPDKETKFCDEVFYMYKFLKSQGIEEMKELNLVSDIDGIDLSWSLSKGIMMLNEK